MMRPVCLTITLLCLLALAGCPDPKPQNTADSGDADAGMVDDSGVADASVMDEVEADSTFVEPEVDGESNITDSAPADSLEGSGFEDTTEPSADGDSTADGSLPLTPPNNTQEGEPTKDQDSSQIDETDTKTGDSAEPKPNKPVSKEELVDELFGK